MENIRKDRDKPIEKEEKLNKEKEHSFDSREESPIEKTKKKLGFLGKINSAFHKVEQRMGNVFDKIKEKKIVKRLSVTAKQINDMIPVHSSSLKK